MCELDRMIIRDLQCNSSLHNIGRPSNMPVLEMLLTHASMINHYTSHAQSEPRQLGKVGGIMGERSWNPSRPFPASTTPRTKVE